MFGNYAYFPLLYPSGADQFLALAQLLFPKELRYHQAVAVLQSHPDSSEQIGLHLISRSEVSRLPEHISAAVANAYSILGDYVEAVDVAAAVLVSIETTPDEPRDFKSYLMVSVRNEAIRRARWRKRHAQLSVETQEEVPDVITLDTPEQKFIRKELRTRLRNVINTLPTCQRELIYLHFYDDLTYEEIADLKGLSPGAVRSRINRALTRLAPKVISVVAH